MSAAKKESPPPVLHPEDAECMAALSAALLVYAALLPRHPQMAEALREEEGIHALLNLAAEAWEVLLKRLPREDRERIDERGGHLLAEAYASSKGFTKKAVDEMMQAQKKFD